MAQAGGSATIYGILYQTLGACHWASSISLQTELQNGELATASLTIEPQGGGGDVVVDAASRRIVEQWKARNDQGTWSVNDLVAEVFPDLYRAVDTPVTSKKVEYRFVTEGRQGRWKAMEGLFARIRALPTPADPLSALDDSEEKRYLPGERHTDRGFFEWMTSVVRSHADIKADAIELTHQKLWHLIANFGFIPLRTLEQVQAELDYLLLGAVDYREEVDGKRRELAGLILELAGRGEVTLTTPEFLHVAQIDSATLRNWTSLQAKLSQAVSHRLKEEWQYQGNEDVRVAPDWPADKPILVLAGESGQGKTWQLAALVRATVASKRLVTAVTATGDAGKDLQAAANLIWQDALRHDRELSFDRLVERRREVAPNVEQPWLTVFVDDVLSAEEARRLAVRDWTSDGTRLALTTLPSVARSLKSQFPQKVVVAEVEDFSLVEVQEYLWRCGHNWGGLPADVRELLKRPLFAKLYVELAEDSEWIPTREYELFERFWLRIRDARTQADHPGDAAWMRKLAGTVFDQSAPYPWPQSLLVDLGFPADAQKRLESVGWLRRLDGDRVEIWHDRLLNWAVAEELVSRRLSGTISSSELAELVSKLWDDSERRSGRYLGYVPLDVLWMAGDPIHGLREELPALIAALEDSPEMRHDYDRLYEISLPTLGGRIIEAIVARVRSASKGRGNRYPQLGSNTLVKIGAEDTTAVAACGRTLIHEADEDLQQMGMRVLAHVPHADALDRLWELHQDHCKLMESKDDVPWWLKYDASFAALRASVRRWPGWLERQIDTADGQRAPVSELAYLLATVEGETGDRLWRQSKQTLFAKVAPDKHRSLARCIGQFRDSEEVGRLEEWLKISNDLLAPTALMALSRIDPQRALSGLRDIDATELYMCRHWWLDQLAARRPGETQLAIREVMASNPEELWSVALVYQDHLHLMDAETLNLLLNGLEQLATARLQDPKNNRIDFDRPVSLLADVDNPDLMPVFERRSGTELERRLVEVALFKLSRAGGSRDRELEGAKSVLLKINGTGLTEVVNAELISASKYSRLAGVEWSLMRPDRTTRERLQALIDSDELWNDQKGYPLLQAKAAVMLAAFGENAASVNGIVRWKKVLRDLSDVRRGMAPMTDNDLSKALAAIDSDDEDLRTGGLQALSVSGRSDLASLALNSLRNAKTESELARTSIWALGELECREAEAVTLIEPHLAIERHKYAAIIALARMGTPAANDALMNALARTGISPGHFHDNILAVNLCRSHSARATVGEAVWQTVQTHPDWGGQPVLFDCLLELDNPEVKEFLLREAYESDRPFRTSHHRAWIISTLGKIDREAAFRACESAMRSNFVDCDALAATLLRLDENRGVPILCQLAPRAVGVAIRYSIGHALRAVASRLVRHSLNEMMKSDNALDRKVALALAGWAGPEAMDAEILQAAMDDYSIQVRDAACDALQRWHVENQSSQLLELLGKSRGSRAWGVLDALLSSADPRSLQTKDDRLYLGDAYPKDGAPYWLYSRKRLDDRVKEVEKELAEMDRKEKNN